MMKWFRRFLVAVMLLVLLAIAAIYLTPLDVYVPKVEQVLSANLHEPVKIRHLKIGALPIPHLVLEGLQVGEQADIALQSVRIVFDARSLFEPQRVIHSITLENGSVTQARLEKIPALLQGEGAKPAPFRVEELQFNGIRLVMPKFTLGPLEGKLEFAPDSSFTRAWFSLPEQKATAIVRPQPGNAFAIEAQASAWSPPNYPAIVFDSLSVNGVLAGTQFNAQKFSADAYGAHLEGGALLEWQPVWKLTARLDALDGQVERLLPVLGNPIAATGSLHGKGRLSTHGREVQALPGNLKFDVEVEIKNATVRVSADSKRPLAVDAIKANLSGSLAEYKLANIGAKLYGGVLTGSAVVRSADALVSADVALTNMAIQPVVEVLSNEATLSGTLDGQAKFSAKVNEIEHFPQGLQLDGAFNVKNGVLGKVDLVQAASNPLKEGNKGGTTRFNELSGLLSVDAAGYHFKKLKVSSGAMNAEGRLDISPQQQLSGLLDTDLKGTATLISMPLVVSGTLRDPVLRPTKSALAGAAVGTAILGPGLGTALGIKAGNLLNKLFGKKNEKTDEKKEIAPKK
ncbi:MAG: hypothetical protein HY937_00535 [Nitrosomonadales bacterium]|nr:hypothetical protein [Nitrosomonadales bacterium]